MNDQDIVNLYWQRNQKAISATASKYGAYCKSIAKNILSNKEDVEECVNDTYLHAWNTMPPHRPNCLSVFLGKITRNLSFDRFRYQRAKKRGSGELTLVLDELAECVSGHDSVEQEIEKQELIRTLNAFLNTLSEEKCNIFLCRYWYVMPISEIAKRFKTSENNISVTLNRIRQNLKKYLTERGYEL